VPREPGTQALVDPAIVTLRSSSTIDAPSDGAEDGQLSRGEQERRAVRLGTIPDPQRRDPGTASLRRREAMTGLASSGLDRWASTPS
jgi:hypothetical protein